ncbi:MAG: ATP-dependent zinc protease [Gammaproteobacteria bacterium]|nr:ATP-dependent zinc protease [Gammaproteobacteria bacterium]
MSKVIGWREWVSLPDLGLNKIKAKIDTGARTSALHAFDVYIDDTSGEKLVRFKIHPKQHDLNIVIECVSPLIDEREVRDSGGHTETRYVIETQIAIGSLIHTAEVTLTNRDTMGFRMLIGRTAMKDRYLVDPGASYLTRKRLRESPLIRQI